MVEGAPAERLQQFGGTLGLGGTQWVGGGHLPHREVPAEALGRVRVSGGGRGAAGPWWPLRLLGGGPLGKAFELQSHRWLLATKQTPH